MFANRDLAAQALFQGGGSTQMVGMGVRLKNPRHVQCIVFNVVDDPIGGHGPGAARLRVIVENRINNCAGATLPAVNHIRHRPRGLVEQGVHLGANRS